MYEISTEALKLFKENYRQVVNITGKGYERTFELTESDIMQGGFSLDRYCVSGNKIEIGSAIAAELTLKLDNRDDRFADEVFEGAELDVKIGVKKWNAYRWENTQIHWIPCGLFTVDQPPRKLSNITLSALDRMVRFDVPVKPEDLSFPITIGALLIKCCDICDVPLETAPASLINSDYVVSAFPSDDEITYRQLIQWIAEISATCAYIDWNGKLRLEWYTDTNTTITPSDRYTSQIYEQDITITGVQITDDDENVYLAGTDNYAFNIETNGLIQHDHQSVADAIFQKVGGFTYRPFTCTCKPMPHIYPLDKITYVDKHGVEHISIITNTTFKMQTTTSVSGKGETNIKNGYATANPLTKGEAIVLKKLENRIDAKISSREKAALDMNEAITNSLGLYRSSINEKNGSVSYYYHNAPTLKSSSIIYTFKAGGFAWTNKWDDDKTVWNYGITKDGNAILNVLSVYQLTADYIDATDLHVSAANVDGKLTASQIDVNSLIVSGEFEDEIVSIIEGKVTAKYIEAIGVTAKSLLIKDNGKNILFSAENNAVSIANFTVTKNSIQNVTSVSRVVENSDGTTTTYTYDNGIKIRNDCIEILSEEYSTLLQGGMINIGTPMLMSGQYYYYPLMKFYANGLDENGERIPSGDVYYLVARKHNDVGFSSWALYITTTLDFDDLNSGNNGGTVVV